MERTPPASNGLCSLPPDCLAALMEKLSIADIHNCLLSSRVLHGLLGDERVWHSLCNDSWGRLTELHRWIVPTPAVASPLRYRGLQSPPSTYRKLYYLLLRTAPIIGLWRLVGEGPVGALIAFSWTPDGIKGEELQYESLEEEVECTPYRSVCPRRGLSVRVEVVDERHAVVKDGPGSQRHLPIRRSPSAEAAASVALSQSSLPGGAEVLGTSPQGSFEYEWLSFMSGHVSSGRAKQRRRAAKSPGGPGASSPGALVHHLKRVQQPLPTPKHPLAGLWAAECGGPGVEILRLQYDFTGASARIIATKVTGNRWVPAGQQSWVALAAPLPQPWKQADQEAVALFQGRWAQEEHVRRGLQEWMLDEEEEEQQQQWGHRGPAGGQPRAQPQAVVSIHEGRMQVAMEQGAGAESTWREGRLWALASGELGFLLDDELFGMRRIDADIAAVLSGLT